MRRKIRRILGLLLIMVFTFTFPLSGLAQVARAEAQQLVIPKDTIFLVEFLETIDSGENREGDKIRFETREDVVINGVTVIPYGTKGVATLKKVKKASFFGRGGSVDIDFGSLRSPNNVEVPVEIGKSAAGRNEDAGIIVPVAALIVFLPLVLFGFMEGDDAYIPSGTQVYVNSQNDINLNITPAQMKKLLPPAAGPLPVEISEVQLCKEVDSSGNPVKIRDWFDEDSKSVFVWASLQKVSKETSLFARWYFQENLSYNKRITVPAGETKLYSMMVPPNGKKFKKGNWKVELVSGAHVLKSVPFSVKED